MTTIAYRDGVLAADSCVTTSTEAGGSTRANGEKLYRKTLPGGREVILATAGESFPALVFVDWYGTGKEPPSSLIDNECDFTVLILEAEELYEADKWCRPERITAPFYAIGSGRKEALAAMACGKSAKKAVEIASLTDPYTRGPIVTMRLKRAKR